MSRDPYAPCFTKFNGIQPGQSSFVFDPQVGHPGQYGTPTPPMHYLSLARTPCIKPTLATPLVILPPPLHLSRLSGVLSSHQGRLTIISPVLVNLIQEILQVVIADLVGQAGYQRLRLLRQFTAQTTQLGTLELRELLVRREQALHSLDVLLALEACEVVEVFKGLVQHPSGHS